MADDTRLKKFLADQEESVQLARSTPDTSNPIRVDAVNAALSLIHSNAEPGAVVSVEKLINDARLIEAFLKAG
jgi:hypothetical protein